MSCQNCGREIEGGFWPRIDYDCFVSDREKLLTKISKLESDLASRDQELALYKRKLGLLNVELDSLVKKLSREIFLAQKIQKSLAPTEIPNIPGFEFSSKFVPGSQGGGDYFDIFELQSRLHFAILLSQSSGYGTSATFLSILIRILSRKESKNFTNPAEFIELIRKEIAPQLSNEDELHLMVAIVDRRKLDLHFCSAGATPALIKHEDSDQVTRLENQMGPLTTKSPPIDVKTQFLKMPLQPKDTFVATSLGVVNSVDKSGRAWGLKGMEDAIISAPQRGVHEIRNEIVYQVGKYCGDEVPSRDWTIVAAEVKEKILKLAPV